MKTGVRNLILGCIFAAAVLGLAADTFAQRATPPPRPAPTVRPMPRVEPPKPRLIHEMYGDTSERLIAVAPNVTVNLCVIQAELRINGWQRNEVRVFVKDGSRIGFKVREKSPKDNSPIWINAIGYDPQRPNRAFPDCLWGERIEIDMPMNAFAEIKGQEVDAHVDSIKKVWVEIKGGDIAVRNVPNGVTATTFEGGITVEASEGPMNLVTTTGNITAFEVSPAEIGDRFRAKTSSGAIALQTVAHRQMDVGSVSGSVAYNGEIRSGGVYSMSTSAGSIRLTLPLKSVFQLIATYGYGAFSSDLPVKIEPENISPGPIKKVVGMVGDGADATVRLTTNSGSIGIRKN